MIDGALYAALAYICTELKGCMSMVTLSNDEVALLKAILTALRSIKIREIDKALVILSKAESRGRL